MTSHPLQRSALKRLLIEPTPDVREPDRQRQARLLSTVLLALLLLGSLAVLGRTLLEPNYRMQPATALGMIAIGATYILSRTKFYLWGAALALCIFPAAIFGTMLEVPTQTTILVIPIYLLLGIQLSSMFFSARTTLLVAGLYLAGLGVVLAALPGAADPGDAAYPISMVLLFSGLVVIFVRHRDLLETDRRAELDQLYGRTLQLNADLERKVEERTAELRQTNLDMQTEIEERKSAEEALQEALQAVSALFDRSQALLGAANLEELLRAFAVPCLEAGPCLANLYHIDMDAAGAPAWIEIIAQASNSCTAAAPLGSRFAIGDYPIPQLMAANPRKVRLIADISRLRETDTHLADRLESLGVKSHALIPLTIHERWIGCISLSWMEPHVFSTEEELLYGLVGPQLAALVENRRLLDQMGASARLVGQVINSTSDWIWAKDRDMRYIVANDALAANFGLTPDDLVGKLDNDFSLPQYLIQDNPQYGADWYFNEERKIMQTGEPIHQPHDIFPMPDGTRRIFDSKKMPLRDVDGKIVGTLGIARDVTEVEQSRRRQRGAYELGARLNQLLRNPQALLQETVSYLNEAFHYYHAHIYLLDETGDTLRVQEGLGEAGAELIRKGHFIPLHATKSLVALAARSLEPVVVNDITERPDHLPNPLLPDTRSEVALPIAVGTQLLGVLDAQQNVVGHFNEDEVRTLLTIANQLAVALSNARLLAEIGRSEQLVRTVIDASPDWIWVKDRQFRHILVNRSFAEQGLGLTPESALGKTDYDFCPPDVVEGDPAKGTRGFREGDIASLRGEQVHYPEEEVRLADGTLRMRQTNKFPLRDADGVVIGTLGISRDITDQKQTEEALAHARDQALASSRLKSQFLANMSHELRTPLNSIIGFAQILTDQLVGELNDQQSEFTQDILSSAEHLLGLINDVLDMSKIEAGQMVIRPQPFDVAELARETADAVRSLIEQKDQRFELEMTGDLPLLNADRFRMKQVLLNLLSNAHKFTPVGGLIRLTARRSDDKTLLMSVTDTGIGIAEENFDLIFQEFRQVDNSTTREAGGTGLGLPITRRLVEMHGGSIWVESGPGCGSIFHMALPLSSPPADGVGQPAPQASAPQAAAPR